MVAEVLARAEVPFGPVMRARAAMLECRGLIEPGEWFEELVVVEARRAAEPDTAREVVLTDDGPVLVSGRRRGGRCPDGRRVRSERPVTALCMCRRSRRYPFCDTSHRNGAPRERRTCSSEPRRRP